MRERTVPFGGRQSSPKSHSPWADADGPQTVTYVCVWSATFDIIDTETLLISRSYLSIKVK